tara:strand:+ start:383 stop:643 length:261 start_codon:yes stop_codon:yes gene_type:complete
MLPTAVSLLAATDDIVITTCVLPTSDTYEVASSVLRIMKLVLSDKSTKRISTGKPSNASRYEYNEFEPAFWSNDESAIEVILAAVA